MHVGEASAEHKEPLLCKPTVANFWCLFGFLDLRRLNDTRMQARFVIFAVLLAVLVICAAEDLGPFRVRRASRCGKNQSYQRCGPPCENICGQPEDRKCRVATCHAKCVCLRGHVRTAEGDCITHQQCRKKTG
nr:cysteine-rich venom protein 6-like [Dermacentor andersoni]